MSRIAHRPVLATAAAIAALTCGAYTRHYSFVNGYPSDGVRAESAKARENGGATVTTTAKTRQTRVVNAEKTIVGTVTKVSGGDVLSVTPNGARGIQVRLNRIDAPEADQPGGEQAAAFLKDLVGEKTVEVKYTGRDRSGRVLGTVFHKSEKGLVDVNLTMILNGWAWYAKPSQNDIAAYGKAEQAARNAKVGLWAGEKPIRPSDWRKGVR